MKKTSLWIAAAFAGAAGFAGSASAGTTELVCIGAPTCSTGTVKETALYLDNVHSSGLLGSNSGATAVFFSGNGIDVNGSGLGNIKPSGKSKSFESVTVTAVTGSSFTDLIFGAQLLKASGGQSFTISTGPSWSQTFTSLPQDQDIKFEIVSKNPLTSLILSSDSGIKELKQFYISGFGPGGTGGGVTGAPEPTTWAMMLLGFAAMGFAGFRRSRKAAASA